MISQVFDTLYDDIVIDCSFVNDKTGSVSSDIWFIRWMQGNIGSSPDIALHLPNKSDIRFDVTNNTYKDITW